MPSIDELFQSSPVARALVDFATHRFVSANPAWLEAFGCTLDEVRGRNGGELRLWADDRDRLDYVRSIEETSHTSWRVCRRRRRNGEEFDALCSAEEFAYEGVRYHLTTVIDLSMQSRAVQFVALFRSTPVAHCIVDTESGRLVEFNDAYARMFGLAPASVAGRSTEELGIYPDEAERLRSYEAVRRQASGREYVGRRRRRTGETFDVSMSWETIELGGRTFRVYSLLDITDQLEGRRSTERLSSFFRSSPVAHLISRLSDGRYLEVNAAYERLFGWKREEVVGRTSAERGVWFDPGARERFAERLREHGRIEGERLRTRRRDGTPIDVQFSAERIEIDGEPHLLVSIADVSAEVRARAASELLAKFFRSSPMAHGISRASDGVFVEVNEAYERLVGIPRERMIGRPSSEFGMWAEPAQRADFVARIAAEGRVVDFPLRARRPDGVVFDAQLSGEALELDGVSHLIWSIADVRAIVQSRDSLDRLVRERTTELEAANRELEAFSYSVSHDMRAPVRAMAGFAAILLQEHGGELSDEAMRLLGRVEASAAHMGALIDALLDLSRLMRRPLERTRVDLSALALRVADEARERYPGRRIGVQVEPGLVAHADPVLARGLLGNLLDNAMKYTARRDAARIEVGREGAEFYVRDNGEGFDMAYVSKLFKPFERLHGPGEFPGTGIGLATVDRILRRHGGRARAVGEPGKGATIYFTLPD